MIVIPGLSIKVICDLIITASMVYYLYTRRSKVRQCVKLPRVVCSHAVLMTTVLRRTIDAITTLALYTITTGALALFVPLIARLRHVVLIPFQRILDFISRLCQFLVLL
jgi:hypothetical protein